MISETDVFSVAGGTCTTTQQTVTSAGRSFQLPKQPDRNDWRQLTAYLAY